MYFMALKLDSSVGSQQIIRVLWGEAEACLLSTPTPKNPNADEKLVNLFRMVIGWSLSQVYQLEILIRQENFV